LLEDDDLFADNRRYFTFSVPEQIPVMVIGQSEMDTRFLQLALNPELNPSSSIKVDYLHPNRIEFGTLKKLQVVILSNIPRVDGTLLSSIVDHSTPAVAWSCFWHEVDLRNYNENLNQKLAFAVLH